MKSISEELVEILGHLIELLEKVKAFSRSIPDAEFDPETDAPANEAAVLLAGIQSLLDEELRPAARRVSTLLKENVS